MQDWSSKVWIKENNEQVLVNDMTDLEIKRALWAMYVLSSKHSRYVSLPYTELGRAIYSRMRDLLTEQELSRTRKALT